MLHWILIGVAIIAALAVLLVLPAIILRVAFLFFFHGHSLAAKILAGVFVVLAFFPLGQFLYKGVRRVRRGGHFFVPTPEERICPIRKPLTRRDAVGLGLTILMWVFCVVIWSDAALGHWHDGHAWQKQAGIAVISVVNIGLTIRNYLKRSRLTKAA